VKTDNPRLLRRSHLRLTADPSRVITRLFVPGHEGYDQEQSRAGAVLARILALDEAEVTAAFDDVRARFADRHLGLTATFVSHVNELSSRLDPDTRISPTRRLLLGAAFTSEYAIEAAALCNPSIVAAPDQSDIPSGGLRFVMSVRGIGEGHTSSIGFRTGMVDARGHVSVEAPARFPATGESGPAVLDVTMFSGELHRLATANENVDFVFDGLAERFSSVELEQRLARLEAQHATRTHIRKTVAEIRAIAARCYRVSFPTDSLVSQRVLFPATEAESRGMEDARFVRFSEDDGTVSYLATYTAYDGSSIRQQLLETTDFNSFTSSPILGSAAANKGLALFPRRIGGRFVAMCRSDRETNTIAYSENIREWNSTAPCQAPSRAWEILQLGNCGSPIETDAGWLVLTHGVGAMRTYSIGALLLDLEDPSRILGQLPCPLLSPAADEQDGYVPNVVYTCGALVHNGTLVVPYGIGDAAIGVATASVADIVDALEVPLRDG
jgi:predicted GH43/DUF377 family glycosyl hydrolase